jgi:hypothetical protein
MKLQETLAIIHQMKAAGAIGRYAIGGVVGAAFYLEALKQFEQQFLGTTG